MQILTSDLEGLRGLGTAGATARSPVGGRGPGSRAARLTQGRARGQGWQEVCRASQSGLNQNGCSHHHHHHSTTQRGAPTPGTKQNSQAAMCPWLSNVRQTMPIVFIATINHHRRYRLPLHTRKNITGEAAINKELCPDEPSSSPSSSSALLST